LVDRGGEYIMATNRNHRNKHCYNRRVPPPTPAGCHVNLMLENKTNSWPPSVAVIVVFPAGSALPSAAERNRIKPSVSDSLSRHMNRLGEKIENIPILILSIFFKLFMKEIV
jgi:hypothetical protein